MGWREAAGCVRHSTPSILFKNEEWGNFSLYNSKQKLQDSGWTLKKTFKMITGHNRVVTC